MKVMPRNSERGCKQHGHKVRCHALYSLLSEQFSRQNKSVRLCTASDGMQDEGAQVSESSSCFAEEGNTRRREIVRRRRKRRDRVNCIISTHS